MTREQALQLTRGTIVYQANATNKKGEPRRWKVNGAVKTWKRDATRIQIPVKHGLYVHDYIDETVLDRVFLTAQEAIDATG